MHIASMIWCRSSPHSLPDLSIAVTFPASFPQTHESSSAGVLQAVAACVMNVLAHHGEGNATGLCCSLVCFPRVGISSGGLSLPVQFLLYHHAELWCPVSSCEEICRFWRNLYGGGVSPLLVHRTFLN